MLGSHPLKLASIEATPKRVVKADTYRCTINLKARPDLAANLLDIVRRIEAGYAIPEKFYRKNRGTTPDLLLERYGVMHLHLEHPGSRELLYLAQFKKAVVLLEISDHVHVDTQPIGTVITGLHRFPIEERQQAEIAKVAKAIMPLKQRDRE